MDGPISLEERGFAVVDGVLAPDECEALAAKVAPAGRSPAGTRNLLAEDWCRSLADRLRRDARLAEMIPGDAEAVQCSYFEKSRAGNWLVPMHQDLALPVAERVEHPDLRGWSEKEGGLFVQPPDWFLAAMVAVRVHLDPCGPEDGPLRVIPGSHRLGRLDPEALAAARRATPEVPCPAGRGDALVMRPLLLHASSRSIGDGRRRVLHFLFAPRDFPHGLRRRDPA
ncbi:phytanoyl-CoA dioxygenase family protein [Paludisphaera sp.]|uniref:phytanoyl-CoA dioxygenase family protein n=1 Tax=Paludisphaera sp. TaxID=2017432 RepID=UPI00301C0927